MSKRLRACLGAVIAAFALLLSPVGVPQAQAAYSWQGTSASATSDYANRLVTQVNKRRTARGLPAVRLATCIDNFSATWATWLDTNNAFQHSDMGRLMSRCDLSYASENLAAWSGSLAPSEVVKLWMNSDGHRQNILSRSARRVGVTVIYDKSRNQFFAVMDFGRF